MVATLDGPDLKGGGNGSYEVRTFGEPGTVVVRGHLIADAAVWRDSAAVQVKACLTKFGLKAERCLRGNLCCAVLTRALFIYSLFPFRRGTELPLSCNYLNEFYILFPLLDFIKP